MYKIIGVIILLSGIIGYYFFTQNKIENLNINLTKYKIAQEQSIALINILQIATSTQNKRINALIVRLNNAEKHKDKLQTVLQKHNLTELSLKKPGLIQKRINNASKNLFSDIDNITLY